MKILSILACVALVACASAPTEQIPPVEYAAGFSFDIPCQEHGAHTQVVSGTRLVRVYEITVEGVVQGEVTGDQITDALQMIELINSIQVIPVTPEAAEPTDGEEESR